MYLMLLRGELLQVREEVNGLWMEAEDKTALPPIPFARKKLVLCGNQVHKPQEGNAQNITWIRIKYHHYCFAHEINIITGHKLWIVIFKKHVETLLQ